MREREREREREEGREGKGRRGKRREEKRREEKRREERAPSMAAQIVDHRHCKSGDDLNHILDIEVTENFD